MHFQGENLSENAHTTPEVPGPVGLQRGNEATERPRPSVITRRTRAASLKGGVKSEQFHDEMWSIN